MIFVTTEDLDKIFNETAKKLALKRMADWLSTIPSFEKEPTNDIERARLKRQRRK